MKLKLGTFNLFQYCDDKHSYYIKKDSFKKEDWETKNQWIKNQIKLMNCDIIGFQEVFSIDELKTLCKELGFDYFVTVDTPRKDKKNKSVFITTVLALASKYPISKINKIKENDKFKFSRKPINAIIDLPNNKKISVFVNHFKSNRLNEFEFIFKKSSTLEEKIEKTKESLENNYSPALKQRLYEASCLYEKIKNVNLPTIFLCDLNDKEYSLCIDALTNNKYYKKLKNCEDEKILYDAYYYFDKPIYNPHPEQKEIKRIPTSYYQGKGNVIDYIFVSKEFIQNIDSYEVLDAHLQENHHGSLLNSDHAQVVCEVTIP